MLHTWRAPAAYRQGRCPGSEAGPEVGLIIAFLGADVCVHQLGTFSFDIRRMSREWNERRGSAAKASSRP
jgi:hypothetical protein